MAAAFGRVDYINQVASNQDIDLSWAHPLYVSLFSYISYFRYIGTFGGNNCI